MILPLFFLTAKVYKASIYLFFTNIALSRTKFSPFRKEKWSTHQRTQVEPIPLISASLISCSTIKREYLKTNSFIWILKIQKSL